MKIELYTWNDYMELDPHAVSLYMEAGTQNPFSVESSCTSWTSCFAPSEKSQSGCENRGKEKVNSHIRMQS